MPSIAISFLSIFSVLLFFLSFSQSLADISPSIPVVASTACNTTLYPNFCKSLLPSSRSSNLFDYGRFSVRRSLSTARQFSALVDRYLKHRSSFTNSAIQALEDCQLLSELNVDFLVNAAAALDTGNSLFDKETSYIEALLSAILTNQQTCLDGLQATSSAWRIKNNLATPLSNSTRLYSISLALFTRAWVHTKKRDRLHHGRNLMFSEIEILRDGCLTLRMSDTNRKLFESKSGQKLLQTETGTVFVRDIVTVSKDGSGNFTTINDAVAAAPNKTDISGGYFLIYIQGGVYEEYVSIDKKKKNLMMIGDGINRTVITGNRSIIDGWTTFNSATFAVVGQGFVAINITIRNTAGPAKHQAVALRNGADLSVFYRCSFEAYQDTLYTHSLRQFYRDCDVYGTVDFIFGNAAVVLQNCNINPRLPMQGQTNVVTAQGRTDPNQNTGISIHNCRVTAAADLALSGGSTKTYLGRPWKAYSRTVYIQSFLDGLIEASGWLPWSGDFALTTLYYAEYNNSGPGSGTGSRVAWPGYHVINASDASNFTISNFLLGDNWIPSSRVPFTGGLL